MGEASETKLPAGEVMVPAGAALPRNEALDHVMLLSLQAAVEPTTSIGMSAEGAAASVSSRMAVRVVAGDGTENWMSAIEVASCVAVALVDTFMVVCAPWLAFTPAPALICASAVALSSASVWATIGASSWFTL